MKRRLTPCFVPKQSRSALGLGPRAMAPPASGANSGLGDPGVGIDVYLAFTAECARRAYRRAWMAAAIS